MYPLQPMLRIRETRVDRSLSELVRARRVRAEAERVRDEKHQKVLDYESTREERRDRIYATVIGKTVSREDLDRTREAVKSVDEEGVLLAQDESRAQQTLEERTEEAKKAKRDFVIAERNKEKIVMHREIWEEEDLHERQRAEDLELEEFTGHRGEDEES